jgi:hypothetical protein
MRHDVVVIAWRNQIPNNFSNVRTIPAPCAADGDLSIARPRCEMGKGAPTNVASRQRFGSERVRTIFDLRAHAWRLSRPWSWPQGGRNMLLRHRL